MKSYLEDTNRLYDRIYAPFQAHRLSALRESEQVILKNLGEVGLSVSDLSTSTVLNVGTGRESVVFHELGARTVYHFDISPSSVESLRDYCTAVRATNVHSRVQDVCEPDALGLHNAVDLCYLRGVLHHLGDPGTACVNLIRATRPGGGLVHFRIYRSGSFFFLVAQFARALVNASEFDVTYTLASERFGDESDPKGLVSESMDHLFVPTLSLWDVRHLDAWFAHAGLRALHTAPSADYDHNDLSAASRGFSLHYQREGVLPDPQELAPFPDSVDQIDGLVFREPALVHTVELMRTARIHAGEWDADTRIALALDCIEAAFTWRPPFPVNAVDAHARLDALIETRVIGGPTGSQIGVRQAP